MTKLSYEEPPPANAETVLRALEEDDEQAVVTALVGYVSGHPTCEYGEALCLRLVDHERPDFRDVALLGFAHLARRFRRLDLDVVLPRVLARRADPTAYVQQRANIALDDIGTFMPAQAAALACAGLDGPVGAETRERMLGAAFLERTIHRLVLENPDGIVDRLAALPLGQEADLVELCEGMAASALIDEDRFQINVSRVVSVRGHAVLVFEESATRWYARYPVYPDPST